MYEIQCLDLDGNIIDNFFQWDCDQWIVIELKGCEDRYLANNPEVHFTNKSRDEALICKSGTEEQRNGVYYVEQHEGNDAIIAEVPNILLQEPYPLLVYVYLTDADDFRAQRTVLYGEIPVRKRQKPSDYLYVENISRATADTIKNQIAESTAETRSAAINSINDTKDAATASIDATKAAAEQSVDATKADFEATVNTIISDATTIKNETQAIKDATQAASDVTQTTIETNMTTLMNKNGLELKMVNDDGNVTMTIVIPDDEGA